MDMPKGEDRPAPPPRPASRAPVDRPKVGPRVANKPQPPLPKRPPVGVKSPAINGLQSNSGPPVFSKTPPPLPSVPPCASQPQQQQQQQQKMIPREPPVPAPRRISQVLPDEQPLEVATPTSESVAAGETTDISFQDCTTGVDKIPVNDACQASPEKDNENVEIARTDNGDAEDVAPIHEDVTHIEDAIAPIIEDVTPNNDTSPTKDLKVENSPTAVGFGRSKPKPPVKPMVKPKPKIASKPRLSVTKPERPVEPPQISVPEPKVVEAAKEVEVPTNTEPDVAVDEDNKCEDQPPEDTKPADEGVVSKEQSEPEVEDHRSMACSENIECNIESIPQIYNTEEKCQRDTIPAVETPDVSLHHSAVSNELSDTPTRPPRKKKMSKSFSHGSLSSEVGDKLSKSFSQGSIALESGAQSPLVVKPQTKSPSKLLQKQDNVDEPPPIVQLKESPKIKRRPSRKAPPPPMSAPQNCVAELTDALNTPVDSNRQSESVTTPIVTNPDRDNSVKPEQTNKSRDSSPQPGKLNIKGLEASMGLSIGKGLQHQMTAKIRPKPKPKPPVLAPKPKAAMAKGSPPDKLLLPDDKRFSRNPSYSHALHSPKSPRSKTVQMRDVTEDGDKKYRRTQSYSKALDDDEDDECFDSRRDSVSVVGVTVTASTDEPEEDPSVGPKRSSIVGMVRVLPPGLQLPKAKTEPDDLHDEDEDVFKEQTKPRSKTLNDLDDVEDNVALKKSNSTGDILGEKSMDPDETDVNEKVVEVAGRPSAELRSHSVGLDDQVFVQSEDELNNSTSDNDDGDYEPIEFRGNSVPLNDSDDPDHIYEPIPELPPKNKPKSVSENVDIPGPPVRPPKRPRAMRPAPPPPPTLSPPTTPMSPHFNGQSLGSPPLPPRDKPPTQMFSRSPEDMYDAEGYLEPVRDSVTGEIYSYADLPEYPFEKKKKVNEKELPPRNKLPAPMERAPALKPRSAENTPQNRQSTLSTASIRTSGGSHIYEPIGSAGGGSLNRENPSTVEPEQRVSGRSIFYCGIEQNEGQVPAESNGEGIMPPPSPTQSAPKAPRERKCLPEPTPEELQKEEEEQKALDTPIPPPQAPPRTKRLQTKAESTDSLSSPRRSPSDGDDSDDDYIYPDDPDILAIERSTDAKDSEEQTEKGGGNAEEGVHCEPDPQDEGIYHEADHMDEPVYNEADDSAVDCPSESTSGVVSPSSPGPPPVPPRDHHRSEPVPAAIRQALNLQRAASAVSDTFFVEKKGKPMPKTVSFESQLTDSALSLSPSSDGLVSPIEKTSTVRFKQRSMSNPAVGQLRKHEESFQEDSTSNSSERPSSWASSNEGYDDSLHRNIERSADDTVSVTSSLHPESMVFSPHGSGSSLNSEPSDMSDNELEEWLKEKSEKRKKKIQNIAREIMSSEEVFVDVLKLLNIDFRMAMAKATEAHEHAIVPPTVMNQVLQYLPQVQNFNEELLSDLKERIGNWDSNPRVGDIFVRKGPFLKMYTFYIREFENSMAALDDARKKYPEFDSAVKAFEASPRCKNLLIKHYMLKPIQRIPQYRLLLQEYQKYLAEDHIDYKDTRAALVIVSEVADHANQSMKYGDNFKKLWEIQSQLIGQFEVIKPGREFIKEGMLNKVSRKVMQPRMFFLFSDVLLYTTPVSGGFKLNNHIPLTGVRVILPTKEDFQNELSIVSTQRSFTISASTAEERDEWLQTLQTAIKENAKRRSSFDVRKLHKIPSVLVDVEKDMTLGTRAPVWVPDARVSMCMLCTAEFHVTFRRHHCRACGKVVCGYCSDYRAPLRYLKYKAARVCCECYRKLSKDFDGDSTAELQRSFDSTDKDSPFSRASIKARFRGISWGSYRKASKAKRPAVLQEVSANDDRAEMSGYLKVWKTRKWKKLWFVLKGKALYTFKASEDAAAIDSIVLLGYEVQNFDSWYEGVEPSLVFQIRHTGTDAMVFRTESPASRDKWLNAIREATIP